MERPSVRVKEGTRPSVTLPLPAIVGRLKTAGLVVEDPRVSEAHVLLTLRGRDAWALGLRQGFVVDGQPCEDAVLVEGLELSLVPGCTLLVEEIRRPDHVLAIRWGGGPPMELCAAVYGLPPGGEGLEGRGLPAPPKVQGAVWRAGWTGPGPTIRAVDAEWVLEVPGAPPVTLVPGGSWVVAGVLLTADLVPLAEVAALATVSPDVAALPLTLARCPEGVRVARSDGVVCVLTGLPGRLVEHLMTQGGRTPWKELALMFWPSVWRHEQRLRANHDRVIARARGTLRGAGIRDNLVRSDRQGMVHLFLRAGDRVE